MVCSTFRAVTILKCNVTNTSKALQNCRMMLSTLSYLFLNMEHKYLSVKQICKYLSHKPPLLWHKINYTNTRGNVTRVYQEIY